jgi:hypothetical protein
MPLAHKYTHAGKKEELFRRITPEALAGIFSYEGFDKNIDRATVDELKERYRSYFEAWVRENAEFYLLEKKVQRGTSGLKWH